MILKPNVLKEMLDLDANAVTCDYPVTKEGKGAVFYDKGGSVVFCGTGCLLIKRDVFTHLKTPYFTDKIRWTPKNFGEAVKLTGINGNSGYGTHDVTFCLKLWKTGIIIKVLPRKLGQRKLVSLGKSGSNDGAHNIEIWDKIVKNFALKEIHKLPIDEGAKVKLVSIKTPTGNINTSQAHADNLVSKGLASYLPKMHTIIDDSDVDI